MSFAAYYVSRNMTNVCCAFEKRNEDTNLPLPFNWQSTDNIISVARISEFVNFPSFTSLKKRRAIIYCLIKVLSVLSYVVQRACNDSIVLQTNFLLLL